MLKKKKLLAISLISILIICTFHNIVVAGGFNPNDYNPNPGDPLDSTLAAIIGKVLGVVTTIGSVAAILFLIIIGIRFVLGSVEEKAQYKESLKPYLIGAFLLFGILQVVDALYNLGMGLVD